MAGNKTVFAVSRLNWRPAWHLAPDTFRLAAFGTRDEAEVERARREANARGRVNPFRCGKSFAELTTIPEPIFLDWVGDTGLSPPKAKKAEPRDWAAWWDETKPAMTAEQHAKLWEGLNRLHFFRVDERPDVPVGYVVLEPCWHESDLGVSLNSEGGKVHAVHRSRERAAEVGRGLGWSRGRTDRWYPNSADLFDPETYWQRAMMSGPFADVVPIELEDVPSGRKLYLVVRRTWAPDISYQGGRAPNGEERVPVRGFTSRKAADAHRGALEAEFRRDRDVWAWFGEQLSTEECEALKAVAVGLGLVPADADNYGWWEPLAAPPAPEQRAALWDALPDCAAYEVVETKLLD
ncbi:MAG: hypothetical protein J0I06_00625 [Planctomycetes bacterium]|nr:hypothetical protein [Planctomycetota bacterium]